MKAKRTFSRRGVLYRIGEEVDLPTHILELLLDEGFIESEVVEPKPVKVVEPKVAKPKEKKKK